MICLEGTGALSHVSLRGHPDIFNEPMVFAALCVKGEPNIARVLEGPVPPWKIFFPWDRAHAGAGNGGGGKTYGLPRLAHAEFRAHFPFGTVTGGQHCRSRSRSPAGAPSSPATPTTPACLWPRSNIGLRTRARAGRSNLLVPPRNFMAIRKRPEPTGRDAVLATESGFVLLYSGTAERPWDRGPSAWRRRSRCGGQLRMVPRRLVRPAHGRLENAFRTACRRRRRRPPEEDSPGGSLYVPFRLAPGEEKVIRLRLAWYVPETELRNGKDAPRSCRTLRCGDDCACHQTPKQHRPWYAGVFRDIEAVSAYWRDHYDGLREESAAFADCFYDTTLPPEVVEAVAANLTILKSPTVLRQADGRLWGWEGCFDNAGCCPGSCTHVWNYAQALPHLFPALERSLRQTRVRREPGRARPPGVPRGPADPAGRARFPRGGRRPTRRHHEGPPRVAHQRRHARGCTASGRRSSTAWTTASRPGTPTTAGALVEPHHNTYDIEFWGPDGMCTSFYLGALAAAARMAAGRRRRRALVPRAAGQGPRVMESESVGRRVLHPADPVAGPARAEPDRSAVFPHQLLARGAGAAGARRAEVPIWHAAASRTACWARGLRRAAASTSSSTRRKVASHLLAVHNYNFKPDLSEHANPQRPTYALGHEAGLLLCTWPKGGELSLPFVYSNEVWTGIEYQVASHLMMMRPCGGGAGDRARGARPLRRPRPQPVQRVRVRPLVCAGDGVLRPAAGADRHALRRGGAHALRAAEHRGRLPSFLSTATGYGTVGEGQPFVEVVRGRSRTSGSCTRPGSDPSCSG